MVQRLTTPQQGGRQVYKHYRNKHEVQLERIPFDETSKFLDAAFDGEKEHALNQQYIKHGRDHYKCSCSLCFQNDSNLLEISPERAKAQIQQCRAAQKLNRSIQMRGQSEGIQRRTGYESSNEPGYGTNHSTIQYNNNNNSSTLGGSSPDHDTELCFILRRLIPPTRLNRNLRLSIPETVIFWHGEAKLLTFTSSKDNQLKFIRQKEKLQLNELRKFLNERRTKYRLAVEAKLEEQRQQGFENSRNFNSNTSNNNSTNNINNNNNNNNSSTPNPNNKRTLDIRIFDSLQQPIAATPRGTQVEFFQANRRVSEISKFSQPSVSSNNNLNPIIANTVKQTSQTSPLKQLLLSEQAKRTISVNLNSNQLSSGISSINEPNIAAAASTTAAATTTTTTRNNNQLITLQLPSSSPLSPAATLAPPQISPLHSMMQSPLAANQNAGSNFPEKTEKDYKEAKEAILYKADSLTEYESEHTIVINEPDFLILMMKRKIDPIWSNMHYLQNFIRVKKNKFELQLVHFVYEEQKDSELFLRAFRDIQMLNGEISAVSLEYISNEQEEEYEQHLMLEQPDAYEMYMVCKIFHFLQTFHNVTIASIDSEWLIDDVGTIFLINCKNISYTGQGRTYITTEMYFKRIAEQSEKKLTLRSGLESKYKDSQKDVIEKFQSVIKENYEAKKLKLGIVQTKKVRQEIDISDEVFEQICPQVKFRLSDLLRTNAPIRVLQKEILGEKQKSLREKNDDRNSQMFSKVYCSPSKSSAQKKKLQDAPTSALSQSSMRETFSILSKINPPHRRVFSAQQTSKQKVTSTSFCEEDITPSDFKQISTPIRPQTAKSHLKSTSNSSNYLFNSPSGQIGATLDTEASSSKKGVKSQKKTLPFYLFSNSKY